MYLSTIKLWNFRKYGLETPRLEQSSLPALTLYLNPGLNLLVGENDSGKTTILDAIRYVLLTQSREYIRVSPEDFFVKGTDEHTRAENLRIECRFDDFTVEEAGPFLDWLGIEKNEKQEDVYYLRVWLTASRKGDRVVSDIRAGTDEVGTQLTGLAHDLLRVTYLKPLRDSGAELTPGRNSRLAQILASHQAFADNGEEHPLVGILAEAGDKVEEYFRSDPNGRAILDEVNNYLIEFLHQQEDVNADITITHNTLRNILSKLSLQLDTINSGLGTQNILFMATELLLLKRKDYHGLQLALIEEVEAHLHPQAQLRVIDYLQNAGGQFILTSHSPNLASKVKLENLILVHGINVYPLGRKFTELYEGDYDFLERFLDVTKANLFFAKGVILVEGDTENILLPFIAEILGRPLHKYGVSIVNVGSTAFLRYSRIFLRKGGSAEPPMNIPVAVVTDLDVPEPAPDTNANTAVLTAQREEKRKKKEEYYSQGAVKAFISPTWTLEFELASSLLCKHFYRALLQAQAISNSKYGELKDEKSAEIDERVDIDFDEWKDTTPAHVARGLYQKQLDEKISKAISAQCLARILIADRDEARISITKSESLAYLVEAIEYVTEKLSHDSSDN